MTQLRHEATVRIIEPPTEDDGWHYFVMEYLEGGNLRDAALANKLDGAKIFEIILRVGDALAEAHKKKIVHRDVSWSNVLLDASNNPKLSDFDLVFSDDTTGGTRTGSVGSYSFAAPEQLKDGKRIDSRADVYGLAVTAVFALTKIEFDRAVFQAPDNIVDSLKYSNEIKAVLRRALAWDVNARYHDAGELCGALRRAIERGLYPADTGSFGSSTNPSVLTAFRPPEAGSKKGLMIAFAVLGSALFGSVVWLIALPSPGSISPVAAPTGPLPDASTQSAPGDTEVEIKVNVNIPEAKIFIDDKPMVGNPITAKFPKDKEAHHIRAEAPGFAPKSRTVGFENNLYVEITLEKEDEEWKRPGLKKPGRELDTSNPYK